MTIPALRPCGKQRQPRRIWTVPRRSAGVPPALEVKAGKVEVVDLKPDVRKSGLMQGKRGVILGVANNRSIAQYREGMPRRRKRKLRSRGRAMR